MKTLIVLVSAVLMCITQNSIADDTTNSLKIYYKGDAGIMVDEEDLAMEKTVLSDSLRVTDEAVVATILSNKLFAKEVLDKYKDDKGFNKRFELAKAKYLGTFYRNELKKKVTIADDVLYSYYLASPDEFTVEKAYQLQLTSHNSKIIAEKNYEDIVAGKRTLDDIVAKESLDGKSIDKKGDIGWLLVSKMPKPFIDATKELKTGDISKPFQYGDKWIVLKAVKVQDSKKIPYDDVKEIIKEKLQAKHWAKVIEEEAGRLQKQYNIEKIN